MTLSESFDEQPPLTTDILDGSTSTWEALYCSHLWSNSNLRRAIINAPHTDNKVIKYCYTCKGKIRKYEIKSPNQDFIPNNHSTPNGRISIKDLELPINELQQSSHDIGHAILTDNRNFTETANVEANQCIPSISRQIDSSFRQKYTSYEMRPNEINRWRLRKSLKGIGCIVDFALTDSPVKKRTQIQACSISVMIVAIVVISFVLVNFTTPSFTRATKVASTIVVPTETIDSNETSSLNITNFNFEVSSEVSDSSTEDSTTTEPVTTTVDNTSLISNIISKIRKNIKTYPKDHKKILESQKPKDIINRDLSQRFCSCQTNEVCMLDENSGTSICRQAVDIEDPTGCGGLCALETEACQLVDRARGVRVCRLLTLVTCAAHEWRCRNGLCVPAEARCDGSIQCYDRSDEMLCECDLTKQFRCGHHISCFPNTKLCDGVIDCWDGFDEFNCTTECPENQFTCTDGQCIVQSRFCDGLADCADSSDEPRGCGGACGTHELRCKNHRCVPRAALCDGRDHCGDGTDELHCSS
ncbi:vitellogenin receptor-like [Pectinophora gossypiella]|uniref:vitellogenin receptor-like n=1 Tax=Pectinophora gossypiella TaxID=13191 RepID=UPI00214ED882|nr:vitellogenin receptor-like [Pectinophora gossypiella]XP_049881525.1 vitellogenin receptor-like [Pectinophora gossypiella]